MFKDFMKKFYEEPSERNRNPKLDTGFGRREIITEISPEGINEVIERAKLPVEVQSYVFEEEQAARPCPRSEHVIDALEEYRQRADDIFDYLTEYGGIIISSKERGNNGWSDFHILAGGGQLSSLRLIETARLQDHTPLAEYIWPFLGSGGYLLTGEEDTEHENDPLAAVWSHLMTSEEIQELVENSTDPNTQVGLTKLLEISESDVNHEVMVVIHRFMSHSRDRGHRIPVQITYYVPGESGKEFEQEIVRDPWVVEALSETVTRETKYLDMSETGHIKFFVSFYNKD